jgi:hypothetical protein
MGPLGWLLYLVVVVPVMLAWYVLAALAWVIVSACKTIAASRRRSATSPDASA